MKLTDLYEDKKIEDETGVIHWNWKTDLEEEEEEGYIPPGYSKKVLELAYISVKEPGKGHGDKLMKKFLASSDFKKAELVFLDATPGNDFNHDSDKSDEEQMDMIQKFARRYGFRNRPGYRRMWLVRKGSIPDAELPT